MYIRDEELEYLKEQLKELARVNNRMLHELDELVNEADSQRIKLVDAVAHLCRMQEHGLSTLQGAKVRK